MPKKCLCAIFSAATLAAPAALAAPAKDSMIRGQTRLSTTDAQIPVRTHLPLSDEQVKININRDDVSLGTALSLAFAKTIGFYPANESVGNRVCPYLEIPPENILRLDDIGNEIIIIITLTKPAAEAVMRNRCLVMDKPDDIPQPSGTSAAPGFLF